MVVDTALSLIIVSVVVLDRQKAVIVENWGVDLQTMMQVECFSLEL